MNNRLEFTKPLAGALKGWLRVLVTAADSTCGLTFEIGS